MSLFLWMIVGAAVGWATDRIVNHGGYGQMVEVMLGVVGCVGGGILTGIVLHVDTVSGFSVYTVVGGLVGALLLIVISRGFRRGRAQA